jgi:hypothetical protein
VGGLEFRVPNFGVSIGYNLLSKILALSVSRG